jgi:predicted dienelactone hydrolase
MRTTRQLQGLLAIVVGSALVSACGIDSYDENIGEDSQEAGVFPSVASFAARGPFATTQAGQGTCTIHSPVNLGQGGVTHPVIIWGNGTGVSPASYQALLSHWASHGFIVAAANTSNAGSGSAMLSCLTTMTTNNNSQASRFFQRVDVTRVGASGHSQGGGGTIMAGRDPRVDTTAPIQPFISLGLGGFRRSSIGQQNPNSNMLLMSGSADTIAPRGSQQQPVFDGVNVPVVWLTRIGADHFEPVGDGGDFRELTTAHFRAELMDDAAAAQFMDTFNRAGWIVLRDN